MPLVTTKLSMQQKFCYDSRPKVWDESGGYAFSTALHKLSSFYLKF